MPIPGVPGRNVNLRNPWQSQGPAGRGGVGGGGGMGPIGPAPSQQAPQAPAQQQIPPPPAMNVTAQPSPEMAAALAEWKRRQAAMEAQAGKVDPGLEFQQAQYKKRLESDTTQHAIDRAASAIRDQAAGMTAGAEASGVMTGRGPGFQAGGIAEAAQRALAGQASDIALGRERDLDALVLGGQNIMAAPGQRELAYNQMQNQFYSANPYLETAQLGLSQQSLGLEAYRAQLEAQRLAAQQYGTPYQMFQLLYGG